MSPREINGGSERYEENVQDSKGDASPLGEPCKSFLIGGDGEEMTFQAEGKEDKGTKGKGPEIFREQ